MKRLILTLAAALAVHTLSAEVKTILCWGDSITEGMAMSRTETYPARLNALLGKEYKVFNAGDGGEDVVTIPVRQGAFALNTARELTFQEGIRKIRLGDAGDNGFRTADGEKIKLTQALGRELPVNPVKIGNAHFRLSFTDFRWNTPGHPISYNLYLEREDVAETLTLPAATPVEFASTKATPSAYCEIILMGANGGWNNDVANLIARYRRMIDVRGANRPYLAIVPYWGGFTKAQVGAFKEAFGDNAVDFRDLSIRRGLTDEGLQPTELDRAEIAKGHVPPSLCFKNRPNCHLNAHGYSFLARILFERGRALGYW